MFAVKVLFEFLEALRSPVNVFQATAEASHFVASKTPTAIGAASVTSSAVAAAATVRVSSTAIRLRNKRVSDAHTTVYDDSPFCSLYDTKEGRNEE